MDYIRLGRTGLNVSHICLGAMTYGDTSWRAWVSTKSSRRPFIKRALELGINFFDTADMYSLGTSEEILGRALKRLRARDEVVIATKVFYPMATTQRVRPLAKAHHDRDRRILKRLGTDYVDLYQIHRWDPTRRSKRPSKRCTTSSRRARPATSARRSMYRLAVREGALLPTATAGHAFVSMQNHYNLLYREEEREMLPLCSEEGVGVHPVEPARARVPRRQSPPRRAERDDARTDRRVRHCLYYADSDYDVADRNREVAREKGVSPAQVALAWLLAQPGVTAPIVGASRIEHPSRR